MNVVVLGDAEGFIDEGIYKESFPGIAIPVEVQAAENVLSTREEQCQGNDVARPPKPPNSVQCKQKLETEE